MHPPPTAGLFIDKKGIDMTKLASIILALVCATVGTGAAQAQQSKINTGHRVPTISADYRTELPERPEMQPRDGDYSFCDDSGGGLACGDYICDEFEGVGGVGDSYCAIGASQNTSDP